MINPDDFKDIHYQVDDYGVATLTLNTPQRKNALSMLTFYEIYLAVDAFEKDDSAHVLILTGATGATDLQQSTPEQQANEAFSSGGYFNQDAFDGVAPEVLQHIDLADIAQKRTTLKLIDCEKPIIAAVNGLAIGGAVTLVLAVADQIYLSEHAWFQLPFAKLGISAELGSSYLLPLLLGFQKSKEVLFFSKRIGAEELVTLQLANKVVPHSDLLEYANKKARLLAPPNGAALSIRAMKRLVNTPHRAAIADALDRENEVLGKLMNSDDFKEGLMARVGRRPPVFKGS